MNKPFSALLASAVVFLACPAPSADPADAALPGPDVAHAGLDAAAEPTDAEQSPPDAGLDAGSPDAAVPIRLALSLRRDPSAPPSFFADVRASGPGPLAGLSIEVVAGSATLPAVDQGAGLYTAHVVPPSSSGELLVRARVAGAALGPARTALVLNSVGPDWDQPEVVGGLVNTPGTEDSPTVSPDGEWLVVGSYLVVDALCCLAHCGAGPADGRNASCQAVLGPYGPPARPRMPGAERITGPESIVMKAPKICLSGPDGGSVELPLPDGGVLVPIIPPTAAYGFHRQPDGTFGEPFVIHTDDDGWSGGPFCFSFVEPPVGNQAKVVFAFSRAFDWGAPHLPTAATLTLGQDNLLGTYACEAGAAVFTPGALATLPVSPLTQNAGNTSVGGGYLWSDDESQSPAVALHAQQQPDGGYAPWAPLALPEPGEDLRQPVLWEGRIYYYRGARIASAAWNGNDPSLRSSFGAAAEELGGETFTDLMNVPAGRVIGMGQPTFARRADGTVEMYFAYYLRTATGFDGQVGVVRARK